MPRNKFKEGNPGRPKGAVNKTTRQVKECLTEALNGQGDQIKIALQELYATDKGKYLDAISKLLPYEIAKKTDITSKDEKISVGVLISDALPDYV
jgi:hypothetical protein